MTEKMTEVKNLDDDQTLELLGCNQIAKELHALSGYNVRDIWSGGVIECPKPKFMVNGEPMWGTDQIHDWQVTEWLFRERIENALYFKRDIVEKALKIAPIPSYIPRLSKREALVRAVQIDTMRRLVNSLDSFGAPDHINKAWSRAISELDAHSGIAR